MASHNRGRSLQRLHLFSCEFFQRGTCLSMATDYFWCEVQRRMCQVDRGGMILRWGSGFHYRHCKWRSQNHLCNYQSNLRDNYQSQHWSNMKIDRDKYLVENVRQYLRRPLLIFVHIEHLHVLRLLPSIPVDIADTHRSRLLVEIVLHSQRIIPSRMSGIWFRFRNCN